MTSPTKTLVPGKLYQVTSRTYFYRNYKKNVDWTSFCESEPPMVMTNEGAILMFVERFSILWSKDSDKEPKSSKKLVGHRFLHKDESLDLVLFQEDEDSWYIANCKDVKI